ncbi:MAG: S8 family serine peptidase [Sedimentisphaerales bacterium]|nr:S8 family serine peptidase [Sedimentisphaerales bacterium]
MRRLYLYRISPIILLLVLLFCTSVYALHGSTAADGSNCQALHDINITGAGINIGLIAVRNVRDTHQAFNDSNGPHVFNYDYSTSGVNYMGGLITGHDTWVAGIIASRGWTGYLDSIGTAPGCDLYSARVVNDACNISMSYVENALEALINTYGCKVIVTAVALAGEADGSSDYSLMYDYFANTGDVIFALASGNNASHPYIFGDIYNGITTAALIDEPNDFYIRIGNMSATGPTVDGRNKPDISCPGSSQTTTSVWSDVAYYNTIKDGATSFAVPQTGGIAALLLEYANQSPALNDGYSEVIRAVIVNSTFPNILDKNGNFTDPANQTWHPHRGYGRIDAYRAYLTLSADQLVAGNSTDAVRGWAYDVLGDSQVHTYLVNAQRRERLVMTVAWNREVTRQWQAQSWKYYDESGTKFNIDITVTDPCGTEVYWETDALNNLTKMDILLELAGEYEITLTNTTSKTRDYGMVFERLGPLTCDFNVDYIVDWLDLGQLASDWLSAAGDTDVVPDGVINAIDYTVFVENWLKTDEQYYNP